MSIHKHRSSVSISSGSGSSNTMKFSMGNLIQVFLKATSTTNIFDFSMVDEDGDIVYIKEALEGNYEEHNIYVPVRGIYTLTISNSTVDEAITVKIMVDE